MAAPDRSLAGVAAPREVRGLRRVDVDDFIRLMPEDMVHGGAPGVALRADRTRCAPSAKSGRLLRLLPMFRLIFARVF